LPCAVRGSPASTSPPRAWPARGLASQHGVADRITLREGGAESLDFADGQFDLAVCAGLMSFVDFDRVVAELARVVAPGGAVVLLDTLGHHPVATLARRRKLARGQTTQFQVENILSWNHLERLKSRFADVDVRFFDILTVPMIFVEGRLRRLHPALPLLSAPVSILLRALDRVLLVLPPLRRYAFRVFIILRNPLRPA
jgi:SAM-dependent methyltransferase